MSSKPDRSQALSEASPLDEILERIQATDDLDEITTIVKDFYNTHVDVLYNTHVDVLPEAEIKKVQAIGRTAFDKFVNFVNNDTGDFSTRGHGPGATLPDRLMEAMSYFEQSYSLIKHMASNESTLQMLRNKSHQIPNVLGTLHSHLHTSPHPLEDEGLSPVAAEVGILLDAHVDNMESLFADNPSHLVDTLGLGNIEELQDFLSDEARQKLAKLAVDNAEHIASVAMVHMTINQSPEAKQMAVRLSVKNKLQAMFSGLGTLEELRELAETNGPAELGTDAANLGGTLIKFATPEDRERVAKRFALVIAYAKELECKIDPLALKKFENALDGLGINRRTIGFELVKLDGPK